MFQEMIFIAFYLGWLIAFPNLRQGLVRRIRQSFEPVLAQLCESFDGAPFAEFSKLPYDHRAQGIPYRILVVGHVLEYGVEQGQ